MIRARRSNRRKDAARRALLPRINWRRLGSGFAGLAATVRSSR